MCKDDVRAAAGERTALLGQSCRSASESSNSRAQHGNDEENLHPQQKSTASSVGTHWEGQWRKNLVLLLGVFLVNSDSAILLAIFRDIASDFNQLSSAGWIINSYLIGLIVAQPLYGKLSDIYGRKPLLLAAYSCCCVGGLLGGVGFSFWSILLGRAIAGIGNAGITVLISTLIVGKCYLIPMREVAVWRGYVYTVNQVGRAVGPSLGGFISDTANWRWALLYQVPLNVAGLVFIWWKMSFPSPRSEEDCYELAQEPWRSKLKRIDFLGSISLGLANYSLLLFLDQIEQHSYVLSNIFDLLPLSAWGAFLAVFVAVEAFWVREPILPLRLILKRNVFSAYSIQFLQTAAQMAFYTTVPLYFKVTRADSSTTTALRLLIITLGTIVGGLISGFVIKRSGQYRLVTVVAIVLSNLGFLAVFLRWRGSTGWIETAYGFPIGLGFGVSLSAAFIGLTAGLDPSKVAVSTSGFYLSLNLGSLIGVSSASLMISSLVKQRLHDRMHGIPNASKIIRDVTSNFDSASRLPGGIWEIVLEAYTHTFIYVWMFCLACGCLAFGASLVMREGQLNDPKGPKGETTRVA